MPGWAQPLGPDWAEPEAFSWVGTTRRSTRLTNKAAPREAKGGRLTQIAKEGKNYGTGNSIDRFRRTQALLGMVFSSGNCTDRPRHNRDRINVRNDHRVGIFLRLASYYRRNHGSDSCFLAQTLGWLFSRLADGHFVCRRGLDDGHQSRRVGSFADADYCHVLGFRGGVSDRGGARSALPALGLGDVQRYYLSYIGHYDLAAVALFRSLGDRSFRGHRNAPQRLCAGHACLERPQASR